MIGILTLTVVTQRATSLNYGENIGNVSILKKLSLGDNSQLTYVSDKAIKYDIKRKGKEEKGWRLLDEKIKEYIENSKKGKELDVDEFSKSLIKEYHEFDLFGGLLTNLKGDDGKKVDLSYGDSVKRTAPVKTTYAFSVSKFQGDMDFLNNIDAFNRYIKHIEQKEAQAIAQSEQHTTHYYYTIAIDLDRIGVLETENNTVEVIEPEERAKRVKDLLDIIRTFSRQIRGRYENLSPIFVIGGVYKIKNPFFMGCIDAKEIENGKLLLDLNRLLDCKSLIPEEEKENTLCGVLSGFFENEEDIREKLNCKSVGEAFEELKTKVDKVYGLS
ncbi:MULTISPECIES: type I-B CRISPR-associated protein Cas7/Cst2/DevR [unclassified Hydrogenobaculum]|uniref:type I-B CRISPR-associated protein Cas7/Cst2/DevR n=1 Tax=unclassified Hydrogenobaculum TaxID=2622382 RepID=UPI0001C5180B|nr:MULTISPECIES: type I-B CRISPR-associated protein Cas7/Cst2/DevR [unclassified Hydrogenobaculum]AEF19550.1 CRISPR-associated autoregulator, DevR family [Hydrogenobaculum sp. 3684]AEG46838.1 CRISPR-associated autoregulator, DevR family [Hydrogenobaculum sp. SHO]AGG15484.1 CRISPR-associated autoregulator, Cst2 family [Hydrogenobaculum sp. HO]AGH93785.1 CRISPR-associated autoregulator, Cst2 family [Hydrogenobaculum sp. SN]